MRQKVFRKESEQSHEDNKELKAQMQDKNIAISSFKELNRELQGKVCGNSELPKACVTSVTKGKSRFVGSNDMVHNYYLEKAKKSAQLHKDKNVNEKPSMINPARLPNTANGCKPKPRNWQASMSSQCLFSANHDECVLEYLSKLNPRASAQNKDAKSHKTTKRYMPVEKTRESKRPERQIPSGHRWVLTGKLFNSCTGKVDSEPTHGSIVDIPHIHACKQTLGLSTGLVLHQMTSAENNTSGPVPQCSKNKHLVAFKIMQKYGAVVKKHKIARKAKKIKTNDKAQSQDRKAEGISQQQINEDKDQEHSSLNDKSNLTDLMKECHQ
ncbi:hypothetical protein Tco_0007772 [Tanacetum coccineum]